MNEALVEIGFMMVILKLPIVYMCLVIYWAVKAEPDPLEGASLPHEPDPPRCPWRRRPGRPPSGPCRRSAGLRPARRARVASR